MVKSLCIVSARKEMTNLRRKEKIHCHLRNIYFVTAKLLQVRRYVVVLYVTGAAYAPRAQGSISGVLVVSSLAVLECPFSIDRSWLSVLVCPFSIVRSWLSVLDCPFLIYRYKKNISETGKSNKKAQATLGTKHRTQTNKTKTQHGPHQTKMKVNVVFAKDKPWIHDDIRLVLHKHA
jgi:hypothetical protein